MPKKKDMPQVIEDADLDKASGGLPAVQRKLDAEESTDTSTMAFTPTFRGGVRVAGD